ncbi:MAG: phage tail tip lysozyme [Gammaproteobacteria bacterium]
MAEQNTNIFADFTVTEPSVINNTPINTNQISKEPDVFSGFTVTEPSKQKTNDVFSGFTITGDATKPQIKTAVREFTDAEKIRYGIDKQNTFFGNLYRVAKAGIQGAFDPDKDFKDYIKYNANQEQLKLQQTYGELASGAYEDDTVVQAAAMATMMLDPFYIAAYMTPWGRAATATLKGVSVLSGVTVGLDTMMNNLATTGTIDAKSVGIATAAGATLGPLTVKAFSAIKTLLPNANNAQIQKIIGVVEGRKAKELGISQAEFKKLQTIAGDKDLLAINKELQKAAKNWVAPIANETRLFNATEKSLQSKLVKLGKDVKDVEGIKFFKAAKDDTIKQLEKTLKITNKKLSDKTKEFNLKQKQLWKQTAAEEKKLTDLVAKRDYTILKKLKEQKSLSRNLAEAVISASIRPALGAGIGYAFGRLWGGEDANLNNWMLTGASLGALNKLIQRSGTVFATGEKNFLENLIYNNATKNAFQKVRELTATTTSSKLKAIGGETEKIGMKLFQEIDSPVSKFSASAVSDRLKLIYSNRAFKLVAGTTAEEQAAAIRIVRGSKEKATPKIQKLADNIRKYLDDFYKEYTDVGIGLRRTVEKKVKGKTKKVTERIDRIKDYFPRVWNWDKVKEDPEKFKRVLTEIFKNKKAKEPKVEAEKFYNSLASHNEKGFYSKEATTELINSIIGGKKKSSTKGLIRNLPLSDHIENDRVLSGTYAQVEKVLSKNGYLVDNIPAVFNKLISSSADSIAFARQFGPKGELLDDYVRNIVNKYAGNPNQAALASKEIKLVMDSIDGFFGRYGQVRQGIVKSGAGILSTISNLNMLDRVTIASLGDLVQPFTTSNNFRSWIQGLNRTAILAKNESGIAKNLGYAQSKEIEQALLKTLTPLDDATNAAKVMGTSGVVRKANELGFKVMGLQWLTGFARRYAYNTGAIDAYTSANKLAKYAAGGNSLSTAKGIRLTNDVAKYGMNTTDALKVGRFNSFDEAVKTKANRNILNAAGITAANRDALIPQVSNRLLFTQSRDPLVRLMGQFMSWTLAKSTQTNKLLQRIENGDVRQLVKLLAGLPVYGGIQSLREIAKYGEVQTDLETQTDKWYSEAVRLSGVSGTATELVLGRLTGPGAREPWYLFAPVFSILKDAGDIPKNIYQGNTDKATQIFMERIAPLPTWRRWIGKLFPGEELTFPVSETTPSDKLKFGIGGAVAKALTKAAVKSTPKISRGATAQWNTIATYKKVNNIFDDLNKTNIHDFGSGLGIGTRQFKNKIVTSHEPFVPTEKILRHKPIKDKITGELFEGRLPDYKNVDDVLKYDGMKSKSGVVNLNVLNVIESKAERELVVKQIGKLLDDNGVGIITTRGDDVVKAALKADGSLKKNVKKFSDGYILGYGTKKQTFQKGFSQEELEKYVKKILGKNFKVETIPSKYKIVSKSNPGIIITKLKDISSLYKGGRVGYSDGDIVIPKKKPDDAVVVESPYLDEAEQLATKQTNNLKVDSLTLDKGNKIATIIKNKLDEREIENSKNIAAGITGNIFAENSKFKYNQEEEGDINTLKDKQRGYGLFQFTDYKNKKGELVGHKTAYKKYLIDNDKPDNSESQIDYVLDNIFTKGKGSGFDIGAGNKEMLRLTFESGNATNIADIFMRLYERPKSESSLQKRIDFANKLFVDKD